MEELKALLVQKEMDMRHLNMDHFYSTIQRSDTAPLKGVVLFELDIILLRHMLSPGTGCVVSFPCKCLASIFNSQAGAPCVE